ncbi:hypothetical protein [Actinomadura sp. 9N215]|uniref:hypothetical protein n=1 Tax=Actinomadura sp. 9N215 TaxID=3375150 RepID=UPI0037961579
MTSPWRRGLPLVPLVAVAASLLSGCGPERLSGACGIVVDGSGSSHSVTGFNADGEAQRHVKKFLEKAGCAQVVFAPISGASLSSICQQEAVQLDPDVTGNVDRELLWSSRRKDVVKKTENLRRCISTDPRSTGGSDVLGGLASVAQRRPAGISEFPVLVISDFLQHDRSVNLYRADLSTPAKRSELIGRIAAEGRIPDLSGFRLSLAGYGRLQGSDPAKFTGFDRFWRQLLKERAKASDPLVIL